MTEEAITAITAAGPVAILLGLGILALWRKLVELRVAYEELRVFYEGDPKDPTKLGKIRELQKDSQLREDKLCTYIAADDVEDILAPFVTVTDRQGDRVKVSFTVEFYKKIEYLHRRITRITYAGWTGAGNLTNAY